MIVAASRRLARWILESCRLEYTLTCRASQATEATVTATTAEETAAVICLKVTATDPIVTEVAVAAIQLVEVTAKRAALLPMNFLTMTATMIQAAGAAVAVQLRRSRSSRDDRATAGEEVEATMKTLTFSLF